ncbi:hypothetical protein L6164_014835 [Bauhinia variegata]|uniref:Uncharacterized protein n=1 Tax=Bauhinia variegata TaxID=167791 RepID=A0ACB9NJ71_BAUVA|nr:hypothetical protein L6164_014835 [Bauhinia variegata]
MFLFSGQVQCTAFNTQFTDTATSEEVELKRSDFPSGFVFGVGTAAAQIEGAAKEGGKGPSIWDNFMQNTQTKSQTTVAMIPEDVKLIKDLGVDCYRFSISWTRILPKGSLSGGVNQEGINHYNNLIDELLKNGIKPFVTLLHFDTPQSLQDKYGGPLSRSFVVKHWFTINEPYIVAVMGHDLGVAAPGRCSIGLFKCLRGNSSTEPYIVSHNLLLAHATVVKLYRNWNQSFGFMEPLVFGDYPKSMRDLVKDRLPRFTQEEKNLVKGSFDFIGINYYTARYAKSVSPDPNAPVRYLTDSLLVEPLEDKNGVPIGPVAEGSKFIYL